MLPLSEKRGQRPERGRGGGGGGGGGDWGGFYLGSSNRFVSYLSSSPSTTSGVGVYMPSLCNHGVRIGIGIGISTIIIIRCCGSMSHG